MIDDRNGLIKKRIAEFILTMPTTKIPELKKVLIIVDYDPTAQFVAETGFSMAQSMGAKIILLHVISAPAYYLKEYSPVLGFSGFSNKNFLQTDDINGLKKASLYFLNLFKLYLGDKTIQTHVEEGSFTDSILKTVRHFNVDLVITASHSRKWMGIIGTDSVQEKALNTISIPFFIVPTKKVSTIITEIIN